MTFHLVSEDGRNATAETRKEAERRKAEMEELGLSVTIQPDNQPQPDGGTQEAEVIEAEAVEPDEYELPERSVSEDPLSWVPGHFIDEIEGKPAINRKGFEVLAHHFNVSVHTEIDVAPEETDFTFCRAKSTATRENGQECEAFGSAHVDRGDDSELLLEMADTRARKRALSIATGMGVVAVEELKNDMETDQ